jgi:hypothetical protein
MRNTRRETRRFQGGPHDPGPSWNLLSCESIEFVSNMPVMMNERLEYNYLTELN